MICTNDLFTTDQWRVFNKYGIKTPKEGEKYTVRAIINSQRGKAYLLNKIVNPAIPNETPDAEGVDFWYEPTFAAWRFKGEENSEVLENAFVLENAA